MKLKTVVFFGSARNIEPPWGGVKRLGDRVVKWVQKTLEARMAPLGDDTIQHDFTILDPLEIFGMGGALSEISSGELTTPTFFLKELPPPAQALKQTIVDADCYVIVSPEYNHTIPPALSSLMGHFGGSCYACKPVAIVSYSVGPWGGMVSVLRIQFRSTFGWPSGDMQYFERKKY